jgi:tetratricopeptide (TPR) repeat protein
METERMRMRVFAFFFAVVGAACGPGAKTKVQLAPPPAEDEAKLAEAAALTKKGAYVALRDACRIYEELYVRPSLRKRAANPYFQTAFLLALREREIGIPGPDRLNLCQKILRENPALVGYQAWLDLAVSVNPRIKGIIKDFVFGLSGAVTGEAMKKRLEDLRRNAFADEMTAYFYLALTCPNKSAYDKRDEVEALLNAHPDSTLLLYRSAFCPVLDDKALEAVLQKDPDFYEAYAFLGEAALERGNLLTAEQNILKAFEKIPESPHYNILLASIYFLTEEFELCLESCDKSTALAPEYRDAYLTKAIALSYLQRYQEAIEVLNKIVAMQYYLLGESHYWLAWNYHELKDSGQAQVHIEESKGRLPTNSEVFGLAGTIALERNELDRAEKEFKEALQYNAANAEALFGLAAVADRRERWTEGAAFYEQAAGAMAKSEAALQDKIAQIKAAAMAEERRARMIAKKEGQLRVTQATRAMAYYNAAVDWANAGAKDRALPLAEKAAAHPQFRERAAELINRLKK